MASSKTLWLGPSDKLLLKKQDRTTAATLDGSAAATAGAVIPLEIHVTKTVDPASITNDLTGDTSIASVTGAAVGDFVTVAPPANLNAGISFCAFVASPNTLTLRLANNTAAPIDVASGTWGFCVTKA